MKLDVNSVIEDLEGSPIMDGDKPVTLGAISKFALLNAFPDEKIDNSKKVERFDLAMKISIAMKQTSSETEFSPEEVSVIRDVVGRGYAPLIVGRVYQMTKG
jgi:hypothetical protein